MRSQLSAQIRQLITFAVIAIVGLTPLIFSSLTTEYYDTAKVILVIAGTLLLLLLWVTNWVIQGKVSFTKTPLDMPLLLLLIVVMLSTLLSDSKWVSIFGNFPKIHGSAASWVAYILFYFIAASHIKSAGAVRSLLFALLASSTVVAVLTILSYFGVYILPFGFTKGVSFTPAGSSFSTAGLLILMLPFTMLSIANPNRVISSIGGLVLSTLFMVTVVLIGGNNEASLATLLSPTFLILYAAVALTLFIAYRERNRRLASLLFVPVAISVIVVALSFVPLGKNNLFVNNRLNFPREIQAPFDTSWKVAASSFRDKPFIGTGPSTFLFNFTQYKPLEFNYSKYWNVNFDSAFNEYLNILGTLGALGLLSFLAFTAVILNFGWSALHSRQGNLSAALSVSALTGVGLMLVHPTTPVIIVSLLAVLAMLMSLDRSISGKVEELAIGIKASRINRLSEADVAVSDVILLLIIILPTLLFEVWGFWNLGKAVLADRYHRMALEAASMQSSPPFTCDNSPSGQKPSSAIVTYNCLRQAEQYNPRIDLYRRDLAQTNFALANAIAAAKGPADASPTGSLTDKDRSDIQTLLSQAITEGRVATALSPRSSLDWEILAAIYRQISGVAQNALDFSLDAYGRAIQRNPLSPVLRINVGGIYYSVKNYELAVRFFNDAVQLKSDNANAWYNLAIALRDKGDLPSAVLAAQQTTILLQSNPQGQDYQTAAKLLSDLKDLAAKQASEEAKKNPLTPPAASQNSPLQKNNPQVNVDLGQKPEVATPPAVKASANPRPSPTLAPSPSASAQP